jgi:membrane peptidoglycan carboxypeptidase
MFFGEQGSIQVGALTIRDHEKFSWLTFREVIEKSSNVGAIKVGQRIGNDRLYDYWPGSVSAPGPALISGEASGLLRPPQQWSEVSLASLSIGQELAVTALQLATAFSALANGGILMRHTLSKQSSKTAMSSGNCTGTGASRHLRANCSSGYQHLAGVVTRGVAEQRRWKAIWWQARLGQHRSLMQRWASTLRRNPLPPLSAIFRLNSRAPPFWSVSMNHRRG